MGAIQAAVLDVLGEARAYTAPRGPRRRRAAYDQHVSEDTIRSYPSVATRTAAMPDMRTGPGL